MEKRILIVDNDLEIIHLLRLLLESEGYNVSIARSGEEALSEFKFNDTFPDVVCMDVMMSDIDGYKVCHQIRESTKFSDYVPIIFMTAKGDLETKLKGFEEGCDDFLVKPVAPQELIARVKNMIRIKKLHDELRKKNLELAEMAIKDELTGLFNLRHLNSYLRQEMNKSRRYSLSLSCIGIDVDLFKKVNDQYGHAAGDYVLQKVADIMVECKRYNDVLFRPSGDEYIIIAPVTPAADAERFAERLRKAVESHIFKYEGHNINITISAGIASFPEHEVRDEEDLRKKTDKALYFSKLSGRNSTSVYNPGLVG
ncbi:MAG: diguanylate cyclase [Candidatus Aureabacteria bacterium]|nr:diguanylate cyclase [Candidatus Auribacterota bacterium]